MSSDVFSARSTRAPISSVQGLHDPSLYLSSHNCRGLVFDEFTNVENKLNISSILPSVRYILPSSARLPNS